jgi:hypothetical protein
MVLKLASVGAFVKSLTSALVIVYVPGPAIGPPKAWVTRHVSPSRMLFKPRLFVARPVPSWVDCVITPVKAITSAEARPEAKQEARTNPHFI